MTRATYFVGAEVHQGGGGTYGRDLEAVSKNDPDTIQHTPYRLSAITLVNDVNTSAA